MVRYQQPAAKSLRGFDSRKQPALQLNRQLKRKRLHEDENHDSGEELQISPAESDRIYDLICIGFGPASLAIAIALLDAVEREDPGTTPNVCFIERQPEFRWHAGMLLPDTKMQIGFLKDLATQRNPRSHFTFLNYLHVQQRLVQFSNLGTFLPSRYEYADYMKWCADHFAHLVQYGANVDRITPNKSDPGGEKYDLFQVRFREISAGIVTTRMTRHLVIAVGGRPQIPALFPHSASRIIHSSEYGTQISKLLSGSQKVYSIAVVGSGQSAAEVFHDLHSRYPNSLTSLIFRNSALRPSDDSPFVNEIFDANKVTSFFQQSVEARQKAIQADKGTNYGVVRLELLEKIYETLYHQSIAHKNKEVCQHRVLSSCDIVEVNEMPEDKRVELALKRWDDYSSTTKKETLVVDLVVLATGYVRDVHNDLLKDCQVLNASRDEKWEVGRDYRVRMDSALVAKEAGIWLQGCNEPTHGLADSLLSILAVRGGDLVDSIFGENFHKTSNGTS